MTDWPKYDMQFLRGRRQRRLRASPWMRDLVRETTLTPADFIWPLFVIEGKNERTQIKSMPGVERLSIDLAVKAAKDAVKAGIPALALFPNTPDHLRNSDGSEAYNPNNLMCRALTAIKDKVPEIGLIADVALDEYSSDGQDGLVRNGEILNDETVAAMVRSAVVQAKAGADIIAPSDMMDGRVAAIRSALDGAGRENTPILSYAAKFASAFYGPFREAADSAPAFGDRRTYQMDGANLREAMREIESDLEEGADMIMVKPAMPYLDVIHAARERFNVPLAAYQVSGEYAMIQAAAKNGWVDGERVMMESLTSIKRAGADLILTYFAKDAAKLLG